MDITSLHSSLREDTLFHSSYSPNEDKGSYSPNESIDVLDLLKKYHHHVFKADSTTTKQRVVFDASAKTSSTFSLNDALLKCPQAQEELFTILCRFCFPKYVFSQNAEITIINFLQKSIV